MQIHASCVARDGVGVILLGPSGAGKSDLVLRLLDRGFALVADDRVDIVDGIARAPAALAGLLEVRGLGIIRMAYLEQAGLALAVELGQETDRMPEPRRHQMLGLPVVTVDARAASAAQRVELALNCALGRVVQTVGAFAA